MTAYARDERGQTTVLVAASLVVLLLAASLGIDWGYSFTQRRVMQNASDAGALAGARVLATSVIGQLSGTTIVPVYDTFEESVYCRAVAIADKQNSFRPSGSTPAFVVQLSSDISQADPYSFPYGKTLAAPAGGCPTGSPPVTGTLVDPSVRFVRVGSTIQFAGILGRAVGQSSITAGASAVARVSSGQVRAGGKTWPFVRHYNRTDFVQPCNGSCTPANSKPITFWNPNDPNMVYNNFMGLIDVARYSPNILRTSGAGTICSGTPTQTAACVPQLIQQWDNSGDRFTSGGLVNRFGSGCTPPAPAGRWYTDGNESPAQFDKQCSIENWLYYLFQGSMSLQSDYSGVTWNGTTEFREAPNGGKPLPLKPQRGSCNNPPDGLPMPSCTTGTLGDWIEAGQTGNVGNNIATPLRQYITDFGVGCDATDAFCNLPVSKGSQTTYGKHVVLDIYLWDCAETFGSGNPPGSQWTPTRPKAGNDCSSIQDGNQMNSHDSIDRVHLLTVAPFTFYLGLVTSSAIQGFWGGQIVDPTICITNPSDPSCAALGLFANSVYLVAEH